jgi:hypothetical protein
VRKIPLKKMMAECHSTKTQNHLRRKTMMAGAHQQAVLVMGRLARHVHIPAV